MSIEFRWKWLQLESYSKDSFGIVLSSGDGDEYPGCGLRIYGFGYWLRIKLPPIIRPFRYRVKASTWDAATVARIGRDWYWQYLEREFGIAVNCRNHFCLYYGIQHDNSRNRSYWSCFLPWMEWTSVRWSGYGLQGEWLLDFEKDVRRWSEQRDLLPKASFVFQDFDGEVITATCHIEEREWHKGAGLFRWLRHFTKPHIRRDMSIQFSAEVGARKGSWKGGTVGHSIDLMPGELHEAAFVRYCTEQKLTYIGAQPLDAAAA